MRTNYVFFFYWSALTVLVNFASILQTQSRRLCPIRTKRSSSRHRSKSASEAEAVRIRPVERFAISSSSRRTCSPGVATALMTSSICTAPTTTPTSTREAHTHTQYHTDHTYTCQIWSAPVKIHDNANTGLRARF